MKEQKEENEIGKKRMSVPKMVGLDIGLLLVSMGVFMYFDYLRPQAYNSSAVQISDESDSTSFDLTAVTDSEDSTNSDSTDDSTDENTDDSTSSDNHSSRHGNGGGSSGGGTDNANTTEIESDSSSADAISETDITETALESYSDDSMQLSISKKEYGTGNDKVTYYVADIYVSSVSALQTAFADGTYGKNIKETVADTASENDAVFAVNGDFYGNCEDGVVIRNGVLYRENVNEADICVLFLDGTMKTYTCDEFDGDAVIADGAWQAWNFGPSLLDEDGTVSSSFNTTSYLNSDNPRTAIGYVEPGHYVMVVVDGRDEGYSRGCSLTELAKFMSLEGCTTAYNLDGGKSSAMYFNGSYINQPADGGREVSDIVFLK